MKGFFCLLSLHWCSPARILRARILVVGGLTLAYFQCIPQKHELFFTTFASAIRGLRPPESLL